MANLLKGIPIGIILSGITKVKKISYMYFVKF